MQILQELMYSLRLIKKTPGFTFVTLAVVTIGLSLYMASYSSGRLLTEKPLPFVDGDKFASIKTVDTRGNFDRGFGHDLYVLDQLRNNIESFSTLGAFSRSMFSIYDGDDASQFSGATISWQLIDATSVAPILGRSLTAEDAMPGAANAALIGYSLWQEFYSANADVVGRTAEINGVTTTIVGVMPEGFAFPVLESIWLPQIESSVVEPGQGAGQALVAILAPGSTLQSAEVETNVVMQKLLDEHPEVYANRTEIVLPYVGLFEPVRPFSISGIAMSITLIILTLSIVNLSSLLFMRANCRQQELAVRSSVGSTPWQLAAQILTESFVICMIGFVLSLLGSSMLLLGLDIVARSRATAPPFWIDYSLDSNAVIAGLVSTITVWLLSGFFAAYKAYRSQPALALAANSSNSSKPGRAFANNIVVSVEVILSCFLLVCCGLIVKLVIESVDTNFGVPTDEYIVGSYNLPDETYSSNEDRLSFINGFRQRLSESASLGEISMTSAPVGVIGLFGNYKLADRDVAENERLPRMASIWIDDSYLNMIDVSIVQGRAFDSGDTTQSLSVALMGEEFAQQLWPNESPIGKTVISLENDIERSLTIVGTIPTLIQASAELGADKSLIYRPLRQHTPEQVYLMASHQPDSTIRELQRDVITAAASVDRNISINNIRSLADEIDSRSAGWALIMSMFTTYAVGTLLLSCIGVYAVLSRSIAQRTQEIGIRRALGSPDFNIVSRVLKQGGYFVMIGAAIGAGGASLIISSGAPAGPLQKVISDLPFLSLSVALIMALVIAISSYIPARKAVILEPGDALRYE